MSKPAPSMYSKLSISAYYSARKINSKPINIMHKFYIIRN